ncbi:MAG: O-acetyl-ADP-ribose deacetylase [candidate division Zixibacteria bacterium]|nr:O-acetyl-ADP-ribose deacetylase [candidate division Zixibacteria bacterium]
MPVPTLTIGATKLVMDRGDITTQSTDAIVNAANTGLRGGAGVDGAIHHAGGPTIMEECRKLGRCPTGKAVVTKAGRLQAKWVIHAVGPIYAGLTSDNTELASAYRESLMRAVEVQARSVAFPCISTGAYGFPVKQAAPIAIGTVSKFVEDNPDKFDLIRFVIFTDADYAAYFGEFTRRGAVRG